VKVSLIKTQGGFVPANDESKEYTEECRHGQLVSCQISKPRNPKFHRKYFALLDTVFNWWEPPYQESELLEHRYGKPEANRERFRKELLIMAGFAEPVINIRGEYKLEAKSISFANMDDDEFHKVYNRTIDAALKILPSTISRDDVDNAVNNILSFI